MASLYTATGLAVFDEYCYHLHYLLSALWTDWVGSGAAETYGGPIMQNLLPKLWSDDFYHSVDPATIRVGLHRAESGWVSRRIDARQTDFDIWYVAAGAGAVQVDGQWHDFGAGDLICLRPGSLYQRERAGEAEGFRIYFAHLLPFGREGHPLNAVLAEAWPVCMAVVHRPAFLSLFERLLEAYATRTVGYSLTVTGLALQLLDAIFEELRRTGPAAPPPAGLRVLRATEYIEAHYRQRLTLADVAAHVDVSPSHLSALFTQHVGCPPIEYLLRVRLREARLLLARGERVKQTAYAVGFNSLHYFSRAFKQRVGLSPARFAALHARDG